jgi:hypothetical protein|nr:MAG TPA: hypothetical protein [Caudoviricetes sp.]DAV47534.1 MAG TPA: hypothetical protein [Caudoviricetes sp.]
MVKEFASAAAKAAFEMSKETGTSVAAILGGVAVLTTAVCTGVAQIIEAKNKYKKDEEK